MSKIWTREEYDHAVALREQGVPDYAIGHRLGRTAASIDKKLRKAWREPQNPRRDATNESDYSLGFYDGPPIGQCEETIRYNAFAKSASKAMVEKIAKIARPIEKQPENLTPFERQEQAIKRGIPLVSKGRTSPYQAERKWA